MKYVGPFDLYIGGTKVATVGGVGVHPADRPYVQMADVSLLDEELRQWHAEGPDARRDGEIVQLDDTGREIVRYAFRGANLTRWLEEGQARDMAASFTTNMRIDFDADSVETVYVAPDLEKEQRLPEQGASEEA
jgi:hypothetical protein